LLLKSNPQLSAGPQSQVQKLMADVQDAEQELAAWPISGEIGGFGFADENKDLKEQ
jgi:hypothetical protein